MYKDLKYQKRDELSNIWKGYSWNGNWFIR